MNGTPLRDRLAGRKPKMAQWPQPKAEPIDNRPAWIKRLPQNARDQTGLVLT